MRLPLPDSYDMNFAVKNFKKSCGIQIIECYELLKLLLKKLPKNTWKQKCRGQMKRNQEQKSSEAMHSQTE